MRMMPESVVNFDDAGEPRKTGRAALSLMSGSERALLRELCPDERILLLLKSGSRVDTGLWFRKRALWVCVTSGEIILLASGRKPFSQKTPLSFLRQSLYNHVTGEVVLAPVDGQAVNRFKAPPLEGYQVLDMIYSNNNTRESGVIKQEEKTND